MLYNLKEYKEKYHVFDTPAKKEQELAIVKKIIDLLNNNKYDNLEEFIKRNDNYQNFLKNNHMENVMKHFGNTLNELDFKNILESIRKLTNDKKNFEKESIKTTNIDNNEYTSMNIDGKTHFIDNSDNNKSIEEQMKDMKENDLSFQTSEIKENTENMYKSLEEKQSEKFNLQYLNEVNRDNLNQEEKELFNVAINYQVDLNSPIKIDIKKQIIVDENDNIMKIEKRNGEFLITGDEKQDSKENSFEKKPYQKQLIMNKNTIYSNNN